MDSLADFMSGNNTKKSLLEALQQQYRIVDMIPDLDDSKPLTETITDTIKYVTRSIELSNDPVMIKLYCNDKSKKLIKFPYFGNEPNANRNTGNEMAIFISLLQTIQSRYLKTTKSTIRDIFYSNVELYQKQNNVVNWLNIISKNFNLSSRDDLNIVAAQKGLVFSIDVPILISNQPKNITCLNTINLVPYINESSIIELDQTKFIRVNIFEKEAVFNKVVTNSNIRVSGQNTIYITGKGFPDTLTKLFVNNLLQSSDNIKIKIYVDSDPYGICIALNYIKSCYSSEKTHLLQYQGITIIQLINKRTQLLNLSHREIQLVINLIQKQSDLTTITHRGITLQLQRQLFFFKKGEMNAYYI
ncbi:hypothetical protein C6P45_003194 [Maudiozyma exigua]|uniref:DNA topoisomerase (ATP-hydrolyzing) n=1 Tax=Maudiozyma exigua TaxID=34358 RepID=A0A9P7BCL2_MAUEX|nr:hypothetical protein C6P45_003194 [Kazachstania exigua]